MTGLLLVCTGEAAGATWRVHATPNPAAATHSQLVGVACPSRRVCLAVGYSSTRAGAYALLAERWDGSRWSMLRIRRPAGAQIGVLNGVSCASPNDCIAVGYFANHAGVAVPLAERWNGTLWSVDRPPAPPGALSAYLVAVTCPTRSSCVAVGTYQDAGGNELGLTEHWDGARWSIEPAPHPPGSAAVRLRGVSCTSPTACTAVGTFLDLSGSLLTIVERWNGSDWSVQPSPNPSPSDSELVSVSCPTAGSCEAVGFVAPVSARLRTLAEHWDGSTWEIDPTSNPPRAGASQLFGVACASPTICIAVGNSAGRTGAFVTLGEHRKRSRWVIEPTPRPAGATNSGLDAVSCFSARFCVAVGYSVDRAGNVLTLAEQEG